MSDAFKVEINDALLKRVFDNFDLVGKTVPRRAFTKAAKRSMVSFRNESKIKAPVRSGALKKSLAVRVKAFKNTDGSGVVYAVVGPKSAYKQSSDRAMREGATKIYISSKGHKKKVKAAKGYSIQPSHYAHLVEFGHKTRVSKKGDYKRNPALPAKKATVQAKPFFEESLRNVSPTAIAMTFAAELKKGIDGCNFNTSTCAIPEPKGDELIA